MSATVTAAPIPRAQTRSLLRGLAALEHLAVTGEASVSEVAEALGLPRASAHILLSTLTTAGYARRGQRRGRYRLDTGVLRLAHEVLVRLPVRERAAPIMHDLAQTTGLAVYLAVLARDDVLTVDRIVPVPHPQARADIGTTNPAYTSSMGKALLAHLPPAEIEAYLDRVRFERRTETTIVSAKRLRAELAQVRQCGYALSEGEHRLGVRSVAAPVFSYTGEAVAAICVRHYTPVGQPPPEALVQAVMEAAQRCSYTLGFGADS